MFRFLQRLSLFLLIAFPLIISVTNNDVMQVSAQEDEVEEDDVIYEDDDDEAEVDDGEGGEVESVAGEEDEGEQDEEQESTKGSPDADTVILFTKPANTGEELPAGKLVEFLVGFSNKGDKDFVLDSIDASFRYPMDFNFFIQNFSVIHYNKVVKPKQEATVMYSFYPAETFAGRPLGLRVNLAYHDLDGNPFAEAVFNQTVTIIEIDEGLDGETFFLYVFLLAFAILLLLAGHHFLSSFSRKKSSKKPVVEMGTNSRHDVDYDWIPKSILNEANRQQRQSPRQRKSRKNA